MEIVLPPKCGTKAKRGYHTCERCGVLTTAKTRFCRDCRSVEGVDSWDTYREVCVAGV